MLIMLGLVLWERPARRHLRLLLPAVTTAAPVAYYGLLPLIDRGWAVAHASTAPNAGDPGLIATGIALLPIALLAIAGNLAHPLTTSQRLLRLWPAAAVLLYILSPPQRIHALGGISVPAAVLMVSGWPAVRRHLRARPRRAMLAVAVTAVLVCVFPAVAQLRLEVLSYKQGSRRTAECARGDARALDRISQLGPGVVLTSARLGIWVPAVIGYVTWVGHPVWTPRYRHRSLKAFELFYGLYTDQAYERGLVRSTGARFVLEPCQSTADLVPLLGPVGFTRERIGCATLYVRGL